MTPREKAMADAAVNRELARLGLPPRGTSHDFLEYLARVYAAGNRILRSFR